MANKTPGNLRDFRIDQSKESPQAIGRKDSPAQQKLSLRQSSLVEAGSKNELWASWDEEASASSQPPSNPLQVSHEKVLQGAQPLRSETVRSQPWSAELAMDERRMEREGAVDFTNTYHKQEILKRRTAEFTVHLQETFRQQVEIFNEARRSPSHMIHVYKVSQSEGDFMLFRNGVKLIVSGQRSGKVIFAFNQYLGQIFASNQAPVIELDAAWGPFDQLFWSFKGERVQVLDIVRYFMTEFSRQSYR